LRPDGAAGYARPPSIAAELRHPIYSPKCKKYSRERAGNLDIVRSSPGASGAWAMNFGETIMMNRLLAAMVISAFAFSPVAAYAADPAVLADSSMGKIWVDANGMTLYTYEKDTAEQSLCNGQCAVEWPPLAAPDGAVTSGEWTIVKRDDGTMMWAYEGHPFYTFVDDKKPGDITGDNVDGFHVAREG
jgi:predicted lipoprotein with Yx(FWY)xxD motif